MLQHRNTHMVQSRRPLTQQRPWERYLPLRIATDGDPAVSRVFRGLPLLGWLVRVVSLID